MKGAEPRLLPKLKIHRFFKFPRLGGRRLYKSTCDRMLSWDDKLRDESRLLCSLAAARKRDTVAGSAGGLMGAIDSVE